MILTGDPAKYTLDNGCYWIHRVENGRMRRRRAYIRTCIQCGEQFATARKPQVYCSHKCGNDHGYQPRGTEHHRWSGGRHTDAYGYVQVLVAPSTYRREHLVVMEKYLGRSLVKGETIHHIDGNRSNNDLSNLQLRIGNHGKHQRYACSDCGSSRIHPTSI